MAMARKPDDIVQVNLRIPEVFRLRLERHAAEHKQSMNQEIIQRLQQSFQSDETHIEVIARGILETLNPRVVDKMLEIIGEDKWDDYRDYAEQRYRDDIEERAEELLAEREKGSKK
jgi:glycine cleavage system pyridoxal-binding protein P